MQCHSPFLPFKGDILSYVKGLIYWAVVAVGSRQDLDQSQRNWDCRIIVGEGQWEQGRGEHFPASRSPSLNMQGALLMVFA